MPSTAEWLPRAVPELEREAGRGAGTGHADDEDGIRCIAAQARALREERRGVRAAQALHACAGVVGAVAQLRAAQGIAVAVVRERRRVVAGILQRLAQGEVQVQAVLVRKIGARALRTHHRHVVVAEAEGLQVGQAPPHFAEAGLQR